MRPIFLDVGKSATSKKPIVDLGFLLRNLRIELLGLARNSFVALMLCSIYAICMSRNQEEPVYNRIEEARLAHGLSRQELADKVGVHYQTIGYLERGEYSPSLALSLRIAKLLKQEVSELFSLTPFKKGK